MRGCLSDASPSKQTGTPLALGSIQITSTALQRGQTSVPGAPGGTKMPLRFFLSVVFC